MRCCFHVTKQWHHNYVIGRLQCWTLILIIQEQHQHGDIILCFFLLHMPNRYWLSDIRIQIIYFQASAIFFFSLFLFLPSHPSRFGSFTEKPVSYLIGVHLHSLIQQSHKSRESQGTLEKKEKASPKAQSCSLLIRLQTYCGRCKIIFPPSTSLTLRLL